MCAANAKNEVTLNEGVDYNLFSFLGIDSISSKPRPQRRWKLFLRTTSNIALLLEFGSMITPLYRYAVNPAWLLVLRTV